MNDSAQELESTLGTEENNFHVITQCLFPPTLNGVFRAILLIGFLAKLGGTLLGINT